MASRVYLCYHGASFPCQIYVLFDALSVQFFPLCEEYSICSNPMRNIRNSQSIRLIKIKALYFSLIVKEPPRYPGVRTFVSKIP